MTPAQPPLLCNIKQLKVNSGHKTLLDIQQLNLYQQQLTTFIGPNGAGKSTLLKSLLTHQPNTPSSSQNLGLKIQADIDYKPLKRKYPNCNTRPISATHRNISTTSSNISASKLITPTPLHQPGQIAWVGQHERFELPLTVLEYALLGVSPQLAWYQTPKKSDAQKALTLLQDFELLSLKDSRVQSLSGGEKQRLAVVRALMQQTQILMLDEPTNHLDIRHQRYLLSYLKNLVQQEKKTILMVLHDLAHAYNYSDNVVLLHQGKVVQQGTSYEVMNKNNLSLVYDVDIATYDTQDGRLFI
ncbi:ABC transporter ATP-binding protein [Psychrobacter lutiphocae]|uniref:ABC transporter ATP-binding protein n=1 Tax=Psychrobacter lutiphocae TaxID=540500 RepID=UPI0003769F43|nr:ABC transporter ATP-binding protein [Psychrobacter lutiphocae]